MHRLPLLVLCASLSVASASAEGSRASGSAVVEEMNFARQHPQKYAELLADIRATSNGGMIVLPGGTRVPLREGSRAVDEAIQFLRSAAPLPPLSTSAGITRAAHDHCVEQAQGGFGHVGAGGSHASDRMSRYGAWHGGWAENVSYGKSSARDVVLALIIDDGQPGRKHRKNIFNASYNFAGAAFGSHARFRSMCTIAFAAAYNEHGAEASEPLVARNF